MTMRVKSRQLSTWMTEVSKWQSMNVKEHYLLILPKLEELSDFLNKLEITLNSMISVKEALEHVPDVGQLLGRLCSISVILCRESTYMALMKCVMWFIVDKPVTPLEERSKSWALNLIRSSVCVRQDKLSKHVMIETGYLQEDFCQVYTDEILKSLTSQFKQEDRVWCKDMQCFVPQNLVQLPIHTPAIVSVCLDLMHKEPFRKLLDVIIESCAVNSGELSDEVWPKLQHYHLEYMADKKHSGLSWNSLKHLWSTKKSYFEEILLYLLELTCSADDCMTLNETSRIVHKSKLDRICALEAVVYKTAIKILETLLIQSEFDKRIGHFIWALTRAVSYEINNSLSYEQVAIIRQFITPIKLQNIWNSLLTLQTKSLPSLVERKVESLAVSVERLHENEDDREELWLLLLQHSHLLYLTVEMTFSTAINVSIVVTVVQAYGHFCNEKTCKEKAETFISVLRECCTRNDFAGGLTLRRSTKCSICVGGMNKLLLFAVMFNKYLGTDNKEQLLNQICNSKDPMVHLETLVTYLDSYLFSLKIVHKLPSLNKEWLEHLCDEMKEIICNNGKSYENQQKNIDNLFERTQQVMDQFDYI